MIITISITQFYIANTGVLININRSVEESTMSEAFLQAAEDVKALTKKPSDEEMLEVYALYKQVRQLLTRTCPELECELQGVVDS